MGASRGTPANMIMAGILQTRNEFLKAFVQKDYYEAAVLLDILASLLPEEAKKSKTNPNGLELPPLPKLGDKGSIDLDFNTQRTYRIYVENNARLVHEQIPKYVYQYFERGRKLKRGY